MSQVVLWEVADMVELLPYNYHEENNRCFIYGIGYITDVYVTQNNDKKYRIVLINATKQYLKTFIEVDIGEYAIIFTEEQINKWFIKLQ